MVINQMLAAGTNGQPEPKVGMGATRLYVSDRQPCTIFRVFTYRKCVAIEVRFDDYTLKDYYLDTFKVNCNGAKQWFFFNKGRWVRLQKNEDGSFSSTGEKNCLRIGERMAYYDPHF